MRKSGYDDLNDRYLVSSRQNFATIAMDNKALKVIFRRYIKMNIRVILSVTALIFTLMILGCASADDNSVNPAISPSAPIDQVSTETYGDIQYDNVINVNTDGNSGNLAGSLVPMTIENAHNVKLLATLTGHTDGVWTVAFSPDGRLLASCGEDGQVLVRNVDSLTVYRQMGSFPAWIVGLAFSPDSRYLAYGGAYGFSGTFGTIGLWNVEGDSLENLINGHNGGCWSLDFQESTGYLVSGSFDRFVKLWEPLSGMLLATMQGHTAPVLSVDFNPHQNLIASSGVDNQVRLWDSQTGDLVRILSGHTDNVGYVKFSPDGLTVASSADDRTVRLWNVADGSLIWNCNAWQGWVNCVNFNPDGTLIVTCGHDGTVALRDVEDGLELKQLNGHTGQVLRGAFNPAGTLLATASWDNTVRLWGVEKKVVTNRD